MPSALSTWMGRVCAGNGLAPPMRTQSSVCVETLFFPLSLLAAVRPLWCRMRPALSTEPRWKGVQCREG